MLNLLGRMLASKGYHWFWLAFSLTFFVFDLATGAIFGAVLMATLSVFWLYMLRTIYTGKNAAYNKYHGKKA